MRHKAAHDARSGVALLEALLATTLLATAGIAWAALAGQSAFAVELAHRREDALSAAASVLARIEVRPRVELESMSGRRRVDGRAVRVTRVGASLYHIEVAVAETAGDWITTHVYRPLEVQDAP